MPDGWRDVNLADITSLIRNGFSCNQDKNGLGYPVTRIETISDGTINYERVGFTNAPIDNSYLVRSITSFTQKSSTHRLHLKCILGP